MKKEAKNKETRITKKGYVSRKLLEPEVIIALAVLVLLIIGLAWWIAAQSCCPKKDSLIEAGSQLNSSPLTEVPNQSSVAKVEVYHFHRTQQCYSCIRLGELAEKTVKTYFADETASGKLVFDHINYELPENSALSDKFEPSGASLWIGTTIGDEFHKEEDTAVWYKLQDEQGFMTYLKGIIDKRLAGDLS